MFPFALPEIVMLSAFDVEKYLAHRLVMSKDTEFEMYEVTVTEEDVSEIGRAHV